MASVVNLLLSREAFVATYPYPFLVPAVEGPLLSTAPAAPPSGVRPDEDFSGGGATLQLSTGALKSAGPLTPLPVTKTTSIFPHMITLGRTGNNDIVISLGPISKFHAFFEKTASGWELGDAGAANGTWCNGKRLVPRGAKVPVPMGASLQFATLGYLLLEAGACWDRAHGAAR